MAASVECPLCLTVVTVSPDHTSRAILCPKCLREFIPLARPTATMARPLREQSPAPRSPPTRHDATATAPVRPPRQRRRGDNYNVDNSNQPSAVATVARTGALIGGLLFVVVASVGVIIFLIGHKP